MCFHIWERLNNCRELYQALSYALRHQWRALLVTNNLNFSIRDYAFAEWYKELGVHFAAYEATTAVPDLISQATGTVLELGPGTGNQLPRYKPPAITHIYGIEPNAAFITTLQSTIEATDLNETYTIINCSLEDDALLSPHGIIQESMDCIISMQVLCSVSDPRECVRKLWSLLKPGGILLFWEHDDGRDWLTRRIQGFWNLVWPFAIGGCHLGRPITKLLLDNADWKVLEYGRDGEAWALLPRVWGRFEKVSQRQGIRSLEHLD